ncbi:MAG: GNAT family N-acetyltransferase [Candidatus Hermodarchaeota archaeon]
MKIHVINDKELDYISHTCLDPSVDKQTRALMGEGMDKRLNWIKKMAEKNLEILVAVEKPKNETIHYKWVGKMIHSELAVHNNVPMGLLEYIPIESALEPIEGKYSLFINCIWILPPFWNTGVGESLINNFIDKAKKIGGGAVIAYEGDKWFETSIRYMPSSFFQKYGFKEVDRDGTRVLLYLDLGSNLKPHFILPKRDQYLEKDKIRLEVFFNSQCPWSTYMINTIKKELLNYPKIVIRFINTDNRTIIKKFGISRGIKINGRPVINRMATWEEIKKEIDKI